MADQISVTGAGKTYPGGGRAALTGISLDVEPGTFLVLLGPSGSGKTTLLRCLAGIERLSTGRIEIGGRAVADASTRVHLPPEQRELSMVFQDYALWPHLSAADNVAFALRRVTGAGTGRGLSRAECRRRAAAMLDRVGLAALAGRYPNELSGGEQQRVALARALAGGTGLILCDEPLSNLDADLRERMRVEISDLVREAGATAVYITHDQAEAFALADQVGVLEAGRLVQLGTPEQIYSEPATPFVARFTGLSGELEVRILDVLQDETAGQDGTVRAEVLTVPGRPFPVRVPSGSSLRPGDRATLLLRPTGVRLCQDTEEDHHLTGQVTDVAFRGRGYEHAVQAGGIRIAGIFAPHRHTRGGQVRLRLHPGGCLAFPAAEPALAAVK